MSVGYFFPTFIPTPYSNHAYATCTRFNMCTALAEEFFGLTLKK